MITTLRDALHENIHNSGVPIKRLADDLGISYSYLANAGNLRPSTTWKHL